MLKKQSEKEIALKICRVLYKNNNLEKEYSIADIAREVSTISNYPKVHYTAKQLEEMGFIKTVRSNYSHSRIAIKAPYRVTKTGRVINLSYLKS